MNSNNVVKYAAAATAAIALLCATSGYAGDVIFTAQDSNYVALASHTAWVPSGSLVELGQFTISDAALAALAPGNQLTPGSYATLLADFVPLSGSGAVPSGTVGTPNVSSAPGAIDIAFKGYNSAFAGGPAYLMVFNAPTASAATQVGVFKNLEAFPSDMATGAEFMELDAGVLPPTIGTYTANNPLDNVQNDNNNGNSVINSFNLDNIVPEPSSIMLVGMGLLGAIGMIRRRRS